jgi:hypothetical protein
MNDLARDILGFFVGSAVLQSTSKAADAAARTRLRLRAGHLSSKLARPNDYMGTT